MRHTHNHARPRFRGARGSSLCGLAVSAVVGLIMVFALKADSRNHFTHLFLGTIALSFILAALTGAAKSTTA